MQQEEQEITEKDFEKLIDAHFTPTAMGKDCFELAKSYHKQELSKVLREAGKELPTDEKIEDGVMDGYFMNIENSARIKGAKWMQGKASLVIAHHKAEYESIKITLGHYERDIQEKDSIIAAKGEEIIRLKNLMTHLKINH